MSLHKAPVSLTGEVFVFTGKLTYFTRKEARNIVRSLGATCSDNVTKQTTYLVTGLKDLDNYINVKKYSVKKFIESREKEA